MNLLLIYFVCFLYLFSAFFPIKNQKLVSFITLMAWFFHGLTLFSDIFEYSFVKLGFAYMLSSTIWMTVGVYWIQNQSLSLDGFRRILFPIASIFLLLPIIFPGPIILIKDKSYLFILHICLSFLAYGLLTIAAFHALIMAIQESRLQGSLSSFFNKSWFINLIDDLPPLLSMETFLFRLIFLGFILLTLTVVSGIFFSEFLFNQPFKFEHKTVFTVFSWILFGALLSGRKWRGWRSNTAFSLILTGFLTLFLAYVGSRFVLEVVLQRGNI